MFTKKLLISTLVVFLFMFFYEFGFHGFLLLSAPSLIFFAVMQFPGDLVVKWIVGGLVELVLAGMILTTVYSRQKS